MTQKSNNVRKTGGEIIVDYLISNGVKAVVGIPGHGCLGIFDALRDRVARHAQRVGHLAVGLTRRFSLLLRPVRVDVVKEQDGQLLAAQVKGVRSPRN